HAGLEDPVLEGVLVFRELGGREAPLARLAQPVEPLALVGVRRLLLAFAQGCKLVPREEVVVARDDRRLLRDLLLPHAHGASFLGALVEVLLQPLFVLRGGPHGLRRAHRGKSTESYDRAAGEADAEQRVAAGVRGSRGRSLDRPRARACTPRRAGRRPGAAAR